MGSDIKKGLSGIGGFVEDLTGINMGSSSRLDQAVGAQTGAARDANAVQLQMYNQTRDDFTPYRDTGGQALSSLANNDFMNNWQEDPGYQFRMQEGMKAIQNSASAKGGLNSGATLKALTRYGQDYASNEYQNAYARQYNRLSQLAGMGQASAGQMAASGQNYAAAYGQNVTGAANAQAAAHMGQAQQTRDFANQAAQAAMMFSDIRLKMNVKEIKDGQFKDAPTYEFEYRDERLGKGKYVGVMAQDLLAIDPKHPAVIETPIGYAVNYDLLERIS